MSESKIMLTIDDELKNEAEDLFYSLGLNLELPLACSLQKLLMKVVYPLK